MVTFVESRAVFLARWDANFFTVVNRLNEDGSNRAANHCKKLYHDMFDLFLLRGLNHLIGWISMSVEL